MTPKLQTLPPTTPVSDILAALERDGAVIIDSLVSPTLVDTLLSESAPFLQRTGFGRDTFAGNLTQRIGALIARTESAAEFAAHPLILDTMQSFLGPYCVRYQLHLTQLIAIHPGQGSQLLHRDRQVWGSYLKDLEPELNLMYACTEFTRANGCTRVVPGSHKWPWSREAKEEEIGYAEMRKGSVLIYSGSVIHSGGHNASDAVRIGLNLDYSVAWLRAEENQFLSCPPEYARKLKPEVQELLGYTMSDYTCNYFSFPDPAKAALLPRSFAKTGTFSDALPPEYILGRPPRSKPAVNSLAAPVPSNPLAEARIIEPEPGKEAKLVTLPPTATKSEILALLDRDGALIIRDLMSTHAVDSVLHETNPFLKLTATGHDKFSGLRTRRTGALVSRSKASWDFFLNQKVKEACEGVLLANCRKYVGPAPLAPRRSPLIAPHPVATPFDPINRDWAGRIRANAASRSERLGFLLTSRDRA